MLWPFIIIMTAVLGWQKRYLTLLWWLVLVAGTFGLLVGSKLWFEACGRVSGSQLYSPSGHTAGSTFVYGAALVLFTRRPMVGAGIAIVIAVLMGLSRVLVHAHNLVEVIVGAVIGLSGVFLLAMSQYGKPATNIPVSKARWSGMIVMGLALLVLTATLHGIRSPAEHWVEIWSHRFVSKAVQCPTAF